VSHKITCLRASKTLRIIKIQTIHFQGGEWLMYLVNQTQAHQLLSVRRAWVGIFIYLSVESLIQTGIRQIYKTRTLMDGWKINLSPLSFCPLSVRMRVLGEDDFL